jgi:hypothetical protein
LDYDLVAYDRKSSPTRRTPSSSSYCPNQAFLTRRISTNAPKDRQPRDLAGVGLADLHVLVRFSTISLALSPALHVGAAMTPAVLLDVDLHSGLSGDFVMVLRQGR